MIKIIQNGDNCRPRRRVEKSYRHYHQRLQKVTNNLEQHVRNSPTLSLFQNRFNVTPKTVREIREQSKSGQRFFVFFFFPLPRNVRIAIFY